MSFPGAAVWHVPWTDKNDALDWQSYFHQRNRFIAALLHSPYERGGRMVRESLNHQIKHLASMQYSTAELRHLALEDVLRGPHALHGELGTKLAEVNARPQAVHRRAAAGRPRRLPAGAPQEAAEEGQGRHRDPRRRRPAGRRRPGPAAPAAAGRASWPGSSPRPRSSPMDAKWYRLARYDSAVVSMHDGTSAALYQRDPANYRDLLRRTIEIHQQLHREWPQLAEQYRGKLGEITSPEAWEKTFGPWPPEVG